MCAPRRFWNGRQRWAVGFVCGSACAASGLAARWKGCHLSSQHLLLSQAHSRDVCFSQPCLGIYPGGDRRARLICLHCSAFTH